jgi:uncharacterized radical SAM superfamily Fe-S cluster-containing enzyme
MEDIISSDVDWYEKSRAFVKPAQIPLHHNVSEFKGCPDSCGFCNEHQQHTCLPVIEINSICDIACPVCLKKEDVNLQLTVDDFSQILDNLFRTEGKIDVVNISGGEPTLHPQIKELLNECIVKNVTQVSVSTNGLELLKDKTLRDFFKQNGIITALQFDGFKKETYIKLRGLDLAESKMNLIRLMEEEGLQYSLVCTVASGINETEVSEIVDFFFQSKALTLMFQPISFTGRAAIQIKPGARLTIPDVVKKIEESKYVSKGDFNPLPCSHYSCFALSYYIKTDDQNFYSLKKFLGDDYYLDIIANKTLPGIDTEGYGILKQKLYEFWSAADSGNMNDRVLERIKEIMKEMSCCGFTPKTALSIGMKHMKAIFIHHFMDAGNFDFARLVKCCTPYPRKGDKLVPLCCDNI